VSPESPKSPTSDSSQHRTEVLYLDERLNLLAIQESSNLLSLILSNLRLQSQTSDLHDLCHAAQLRLTYVLLRAPVPDLERHEYLALHRHSQTCLAQALQRLPETIARLSKVR